MAKISQKTTGYTVTSGLQKVFIALAASVVAIQLLTSLYYASAQYPTNQNLSAFLPMIIETTVSIIIFFGLPFFLTRNRKAPLLDRVFGATFLAMTGTLGVVAVSSLTIPLFGALQAVAYSYESSLLLSYGPSAFVMVLYAVVVTLYLRKK